MPTLLAMLACAIFGAAQAQSYPSKPIRLIVPYAAGGTSDILARQLGPKVTEGWGQPVVIENKTGANGNVGADFVAKSAPQGLPGFETGSFQGIVGPNGIPRAVDTAEMKERFAKQGTEVRTQSREGLGREIRLDGQKT